tara:strand:+ start:2523 stop:3359 length:837 start_codon:yes stop_codon:yes gene_type:complete
MKSYLIISAIFFYILTCQSQQSFTLKSAEDQTSIAYASISSEHTLLTTSDSLGKFTIQQEDLHLPITIKALGYKTLDSFSLDTKSPVIFLEAQAVTLDEVVLQQQKKEHTYKVGKVKNGDIGIVCRLQNNTIAQVAKVVKNEFSKATWIDQVKFKTLCTAENRIISLVLYAVNEQGQPGRILHTEKIIAQLKKGHHTYEIDLKHLQIPFPENGVFVALNYLFLEQNKAYSKTNPSWYHYEPSIDATSVDHYTDSWYKLKQHWQKSNTYSLNMQLILSD